jgi:TM2 domain-containing membrane protein YozV
LYCRNCGNVVSERAVACPKCGVLPLSGTNVCWSCASKTTPGAITCTKCGAVLENPSPNRTKPASATYSASASKSHPLSATSVQFSEKSRLAAGLLGIFLGGIGVHRFYLGYTGIGIIQIIVTIITATLGSLWGFIEGIMILAGGFNNDGRGRLLKPL